MENTNSYEIDVIDSLVTITIKQDVFELLTNRTKSELLLESLNKFKTNSKIKALLFLNKPGCYGEKVYDTFLNNIISSESKSNNFEKTSFCDRIIRFRQILTLNHFVKYIANYNKLCFTMLSGNIVTPFFGISLATDRRFATPETSFVLDHHKYGLHPSGGLPYFLTKRLGYERALELMLQESISAKQALELGIIDKIVPNNKILEIVVKDIEKLTQLRSSSLKITKNLAAFDHKSLSEYFEYEASFLNL